MNGCPGCSAIREGKAAQNHNEECRTRVKEKLAETPEGRRRLEQEDDKFNKELASRIEEAERKNDDASSFSLVIIAFTPSYMSCTN